MGWADQPIERLKLGMEARFRPTGHSMEPRIRSGQLCVVQPIASPYGLNRGDVVLCVVGKQQYLHQVLSIDSGKRQVLISNMKGGVNGWTPFERVYGRLTEVLP